MTAPMTAAPSAPAAQKMMSAHAPPRSSPTSPQSPASGSGRRLTPRSEPGKGRTRLLMCAIYCGSSPAAVPNETQPRVTEQPTEGPAMVVRGGGCGQSTPTPTSRHMARSTDVAFCSPY